jgi:hypothetical protein
VHHRHINGGIRMEMPAVRSNFNRVDLVRRRCCSIAEEDSTITGLWGFNGHVLRRD